MRLRKLVALLSIPVILLLFHNRIANWHLHVLYNGIVVEHAHPFSPSKSTDSPYQKHSHSSWEMFIYEVITSITPLLILFFLLFAKLDLENKHETPIAYRYFTPVAILSPHTYRGPPSI